MKIVCDACQAKYSISDDKVQGKVFKIRCKKCSNIIVVRGSAGAAEPAPSPQQEKETHVYDYGYQGGEQPPADDAVWHCVINQEQAGPMTAGEVQQRFRAGEIDGETYIWREGFADWMPLSQVDVFASLVAASAAVVPASQGGGGQAAVAAMFGAGGDDVGTSRSDPGDLFAAASTRRHEEEDAGGDLFGTAPVPQQQAANQKLRGERNENSVLFSLNNLAQLASDKPAPVTAAPTGHATGAAGGEGSGLIDIRSMASAYLGNAGAAAKPAASVGSVDDLPVFGGGGFHEPAVIVPTARAANNNKLLYIMLGAVGLVAAAALVLVVILVKGGKDKDKDGDKGDKVAMADTKSGDDSGKPATSDKAPDKQPATSAGSGTPPATTGGDTKTASTDTKTAEPAKTNDTSPTDNKTDTKAATPPEQPKAPPKKTPTRTASNNPPPKRDTSTRLDPNVMKTVGNDTRKTDNKKTTTSSGGGGDCDEVSCTIGTASGPCCDRFKKGGGGSTAKKPTGGGDLPAQLDREMISSGMGPVKGRAQSCGDKAPGVHGLVKVHVKVGGDGRVANVSVSQTPDDKLGACVSAAVSRASFAKTQNGGSFSFPFPF